MQNTITDKGKQLQESFPPIRTFKSTKRYVFHFMLLTVRFSLCSLFGIRGSSFQDLRFFFFLICLLIITLNNYIYKTHTHKKKLSNYYRRSYRAKRNCKKSTTGQ